MSIKRSFLIILAAIFALLFNAYMFFHGLLHKDGSRIALGYSDKYDGETASQSAKNNPNKMLFVSCGGFLE